MKNKKLEIGKTYISKAGHIRKLVKVEDNVGFFENLNKDFDDYWFYEEDGTYGLDLEQQEHLLNNDTLKEVE